MSSHIRTVSELIAHFGGPRKLARVLDTYEQMVIVWRHKNYIPAIHYKRHMWLLKHADPELLVSPDLYGWLEAPAAAE